MENLPLYLSVMMMLITALTVFIFYMAANRSKTVLFILAGWMILQTVISVQGFYTVTTTLPPRFALTIVPPFVFIVLLFVTRKGRQFIASSNIKSLTLLHTVRIPVEIVLLGLFIYKTIPEIMTFEGRNFDILSGLSAPVIYYFMFVRRKLPAALFLLWNILCIGLLVNIVVTAVLAAPFPFQQLAFEQPNIAVLYFPFVWLPAVIIPLVLLSHLASMYQVIKNITSHSLNQAITLQH